MEPWLSLAVGVVGIAATLTAWFFNPKRKMFVELDIIFKKWEELAAKRDKALAENDNDTLTIVNAELGKLRTRKVILMARL